MFPDTRRVIHVVARSVRVGELHCILWRPSPDGWEAADREAGIGMVERRDHDSIRIAGWGADTFILRSPPIAETSLTPGMGLGVFWAEGLNEKAGDALRTGPIRITVLDLHRASSKLFAQAAAGHIVIAGKEVPVRPGAAYVELRPEDAGLWVLGLVADTATPLVEGTAPRFAGVRIFSVEQWHELHPAVQHPAIHAPKSAKQPQEDVSRWLLERAKAVAPRKMKRADAMQDCMRKIGATHRQALKAYQALPEDLRISQGRPRKRDG